jgi:hypothetical protein
MSWQNLVAEPSNKFTYLFFRAHFCAMLRTMRKALPSLYLLDENVVTIPFYIILPRFVPYSETFKEQIELMISNGLVGKLNAESWSFNQNEKRYVEEVKPQILTVEHLSLGFLAILISLVVSLCVFLVEIMTKLR